MSAKIKYTLKQKEGVLHIGGGRFFYPEIAYSLTQSEIGCYGQYFDKETEKDPELPPAKPEEEQPEIPEMSPELPSTKSEGDKSGVPAMLLEVPPAKPKRRQPVIPAIPQEESPANPEGEQPEIPETLPGSNSQEDRQGAAFPMGEEKESSTLGNLDEIMKG